MEALSLILPIIAIIAGQIISAHLLSARFGIPKSQNDFSNAGKFYEYQKNENKKFEHWLIALTITNVLFVFAVGLISSLHATMSMSLALITLLVSMTAFWRQR